MRVGRGTSRRAARPSRRSGGASAETMRIFGFPPFEDRRDAGRRLAGKLSRFEGERPVVFALPRGGVPVGYEISRSLGAPLDVFVSRKLGAPGQPEFGIGAVAAGGVRILNAGRGQASRHPRRLRRADHGPGARGGAAEATLLQGREARDGSGGADRDPGRRRPRYRGDGPRRRTSPAVAEAGTPGPGSAGMRRPDRGSLREQRWTSWSAWSLPRTSGP